MSHIEKQVGGACIDGVVKCLAHNKPLTCAIEVSDHIDADSEKRREYESRTRDWFHTTIEFERSIQVSLKTLLEKIAHADDPVTKQLSESHQVIKSRFDDIKSALRLLLHTPLTTPPIPSATGAQVTQLTTKVNEMEVLLCDASRSAVSVKDAISKLELALAGLQTSLIPIHVPSGLPGRDIHEDEIHDRNFHLANVRRMFSASCEEYTALIQDTTSMTEIISTNHSMIDSLVHTLQQQARTCYNQHHPNTPTLVRELGGAATDSISEGAPLVVSVFGIYHWARQRVNTLAALLPPPISRRRLNVPSQPKRRCPLGALIGFSSIGLLLMLIVCIRRLRDGVGDGGGQSVPSYPIWDSLLASDFDTLDETFRMMPARVA